MFYFNEAGLLLFAPFGDAGLSRARARRGPGGRDAPGATAELANRDGRDVFVCAEHRRDCPLPESFLLASNAFFFRVQDIAVCTGRVTCAREASPLVSACYGAPQVFP